MNHVKEFIRDVIFLLVVLSIMFLLGYGATYIYQSVFEEQTLQAEASVFYEAKETKLKEVIK